jgi:hypothetical protein
MKKMELNPEAKNIEFRIETTFEKLEKMGWDFDGIEPREGDYPVIELRKEEGKELETYWMIHSYTTNESFGLEETGDDKLTLKNVIELIPETLPDDIDDCSHGNEGYVNTFIFIEA